MMKGEGGEKDMVLNDFLENISIVVIKSIKEFIYNAEVRTSFAAEVEKQKVNRAGASKQANREERRKKIQ